MQYKLHFSPNQATPASTDSIAIDTVGRKRRFIRRSAAIGRRMAAMVVMVEVRLSSWLCRVVRVIGVRAVFFLDPYTPNPVNRIVVSPKG